MSTSSPPVAPAATPSSGVGDRGLDLVEAPGEAEVRLPTLKGVCA